MVPVVKHGRVTRAKVTHLLFGQVVNKRQRTLRSDTVGFSKEFVGLG